jgi:hypothetical protein
MSRSAQQPSGDLARCVTHEADDTWPVMLEIVAYWGNDRRGKSRRIEISADQFFGRGGYGAPMSGEQLIGMVNRLRRQK